MCRVIAVSNQKGGVGKTVSCVNLGIGLAQEGKKVLLIDADPQGSLTISLGYEEPDEMEYSLATLMMNIVNDEKLNIEKTILHHKEGVDLIPANIELSAIEVSLVNAMSRELILRSMVDRLREFYDYIIIDCMPSLGSIDVIGELCGDSAKQVQRYIKMTELIPALLDKVDDGSMGFTPAVQLSYLKKKEQQEIIDAMEATQCTPSLSQAIRIKKLSEAGKLTESEEEGILGEIKQKEADRVVFKNEQLYRFFPSTYTSEQMRREILEILKSWRNSNWI